MFYFTSRDAKTVRHHAWIVLIDIFISKILQPTRSLYDFRLTSYGSSSGFNVFVLLIKLGMKYWNLLAKFHENPSRFNGGGGGIKG